MRTPPAAKAVAEGKYNVAKKLNALLLAVTAILMAILSQRLRPDPVMFGSTRQGSLPYGALTFSCEGKLYQWNVRQPPRLLWSPPSGMTMLSPDVCPGGREVVFEDGVRKEICFLDLPSGSYQRVPQPAQWQGWMPQWPAWSPHCGKVAYFHVVANDRGRLFTLEPSSPLNRMVSDHLATSAYGRPTWSVDGQSIFQCVSVHDRLWVASFDISTGTYTRLFEGSKPAVSPSGTMIAFARDETLRLRTLSGNHERTLAKGVSPSEITWAPNSDYVAFMHGAKGLITPFSYVVDLYDVRSGKVTHLPYPFSPYRKWYSISWIETYDGR